MISPEIKRAALLLLVVLLLVACASREARRVLENLYLGAPAVMLLNWARPLLQEDNGPECLVELERLQVPFRKLGDKKLPEECTIENGVTLRSPLAEKRHMTCALAVALIKHYREDLVPLAQELFGSPVGKIEDLGVRNCRTMEGHSFLLSEHAYANAIDFHSYTLADGTVLNVERDWHRGDRRALFVREAAARACLRFRTVLSPDTDEVHKDHLHADLGIWSDCSVNNAEISKLRADLQSVGPIASTELKIIPRADWGWAAAPYFGPRQEINGITIHHSGKAIDAKVPPVRYLRNLLRFSREKQQWPDLPYHFIIARSGAVLEGAPLEIPGSTNTDYDTLGQLQVVLLGDLETTPPAAEQTAALERLIALLREQHALSQDAVRMHRERASGTVCPGRFFSLHS